MNRICKVPLLLWSTMLMGTMAISCSHTEESIIESPQGAQANTRTVGTKTPKLAVYIETNDVNPLNAGEYYFCDTILQEEVIDQVILFASNIRQGGTNYNPTAMLYHNPNQTYILNHADSLIAPLQQKGIKVLLGLLGDHTPVGFANLTPNMIDSFAGQIANCVNTYGLDGVAFSDLYANYSMAPPLLPAPSSTIFGNLIQEVRRLLPDKLITAFHFGGNTYFDQATMDALSYMWPNYGCSPTPPLGLPNSKWAKLSINFSPLNPSQAVIQNCANNYAGYGSIMTFNMREWNSSNIMNFFARRVWGGKTVCWTGISHPKNY